MVIQVNETEDIQLPIVNSVKKKKTRRYLWKKPSSQGHQPSDLHNNGLEKMNSINNLKFPIDYFKYFFF